MKKIRNVALFPFLLVLFALSMILYYLSKLIRALAYILMMHWYSAKDELKEFWIIESNPADFM
jgi:hypothetical protein